MIKNIFIDLDDTVFDFHKGERDALSKSLLEYGITPDEDLLSTYHEVNKAHWKMLEKGMITKSELNHARFREFFLLKNIDVSAHSFCLLYESKLACEHYLMSGAEKLIVALSEKYKIYAASNGYTKTQIGRLALSGMDKYFDGIFISEEMGYDKPAKGFFDNAFTKVDGFRADESVMIGDSLSSDILGGINAGIKTIWFNNKNADCGEIKPDYEVHSLEEIINLLDYMNEVLL